MHFHFITTLLVLLSSLVLLVNGQGAGYLIAYPCRGEDNFLEQQRWVISTSTSNNLNVISLQHQLLCIDCSKCAVGTDPWLWGCSTNANTNSNSNQLWTILDASTNQPIKNLTNKIIKLQSIHNSGNCITAVVNTTDNILVKNARLTLTPCNLYNNGTNQSQLFEYNNDSFEIEIVLQSDDSNSNFRNHATTNLCLTQDRGLLMNANCSVAPFSTYPYCDQGKYTV